MIDYIYVKLLLNFYAIVMPLFMLAVCMQMPNSLKARLQSAAAGGVRAHLILTLFVLTG